MMVDYRQRSLLDWGGENDGVSPLKKSNNHIPTVDTNRFLTLSPPAPRILPAKAEGRALSLRDAQSFVLGVIQQLPSGYEFTLKGLFPQLRIRGDPRRRASVLIPPRQRGLIQAVGVTTADQEGRNKGLATKWRVKK